MSRVLEEGTMGLQMQCRAGTYLPTFTLDMTGVSCLPWIRPLSSLFLPSSPNGDGHQMRRTFASRSCQTIA